MAGYVSRIDKPHRQAHGDGCHSERETIKASHGSGTFVVSQVEKSPQYHLFKGEEFALNSQSSDPADFEPTCICVITHTNIPTQRCTHIHLELDSHNSVDC